MSRLPRPATAGRGGREPAGVTGITCGAHGRSAAAFVCTHLREGGPAGWNTSHTGWGELCPDAWCDACEAGAWSNGGSPPIAALCVRCYHEARGRHGTFPDPNEACRQAASLNDDLIAAGFLEGGRWNLDLDTGILSFREVRGGPRDFRIACIGSWSANRGTWLWAWANESLPNEVAARAHVVRGYGSRHPEFAVASVACERGEAWHQAGIGAVLIGARGVYRCPMDGLDVYVALLDEVGGEG